MGTFWVSEVNQGEMLRWMPDFYFVVGCLYFLHSVLLLMKAYHHEKYCYVQVES